MYYKEMEMTTKTYLTTEQFIKVFKSLSDEKKKELSAAHNNAWSESWARAWDEAWDEMWYEMWDESWARAWDRVRDEAWVEVWEAARDTDLAIRTKDFIPTEHFDTLISPWTSCGLSLYAEDWEDVLKGVEV